MQVPCQNENPNGGKLGPYPASARGTQTPFSQEPTPPHGSPPELPPLFRRHRQDLKNLVGRHGIRHSQFSRFFQFHLVIGFGKGVLGGEQEAGGLSLGIKELLGIQPGFRRQLGNGQGF